MNNRDKSNNFQRPCHVDRARFPRQLVIALLLMTGSASPFPLSAAETSPLVEQLVENLRTEYRQDQWARLAESQDRDSLIAAVLLGMPDAIEHVAIRGHSGVERRLEETFGQDPEVLFVLALACQMQRAPCDLTYDRLTKAEPDNALNWLLLPNGTGPDSAQLESAAAAPYADTRLKMVTRILGTALSGQFAAHSASVDDPIELDSLLRVDAMERVPLPTFAGVMSVCKPSALENRNECVRLGRLLSADRDGTILTKMIGSAILRRFLKGTEEEKDAIQMRREYVWLSEQLESSEGSWKVQLRSDLVEIGEWAAVQRAVEELGKPSKPSPDWVPKNPQALLLSEERLPAPEK